MESVDAFWTRCCETLGPEVRARGYTERQIGNTPALVDLVLDLIISGEKRGTFSLPEKLARDGTTPAPGDYVILTRYDGSAGCLVQVEACETMPFDQVGPAELEIEGPGARDPAVWRDIHERYWTPMLTAWGQTFTTSQPVLVQWFRLLETAQR